MTVPGAVRALLAKRAALISVGRLGSPNEEVTYPSPPIRSAMLDLPESLVSQDPRTPSPVLHAATGAQISVRDRNGSLQVHGGSVDVARALQVAIQCTPITRKKGRLSRAIHRPQLLIPLPFSR